MTQDEILAMKSGKQLDALVHQYVMQEEILTYEEMITEAEKVWKEQPQRIFFHKFIAYRDKDGNVICEQIIPPYSTDIETARRVLRRIAPDGHNPKFGSISLGQYWPVLLNSMLNLLIHLSGDTIPEVICKAALLRVMAKRNGVGGTD